MEYPNPKYTRLHTLYSDITYNIRIYKYSLYLLIQTRLAWWSITYICMCIGKSLMKTWNWISYLINLRRILIMLHIPNWPFCMKDFLNIIVVCSGIFINIFLHIFAYYFFLCTCRHTFQNIESHMYCFPLSSLTVIKNKCTLYDEFNPMVFQPYPSPLNYPIH